MKIAEPNNFDLWGYLKDHGVTIAKAEPTVSVLCEPAPDQVFSRQETLEAGYRYYYRRYPQSINRVSTGSATNDIIWALLGPVMVVDGDGKNTFDRRKEYQQTDEFKRNAALAEAEWLRHNSKPLWHPDRVAWAYKGGMQP